MERKTEVYISNENLEDISVEPELGEEQLVFRKGRGTTDGMFSLRQLIENRLEKQGHIALAFVDQEKAFDTVPRKNGNGYSEMDGSTRVRGKNG